MEACHERKLESMKVKEVWDLFELSKRTRERHKATLVAKGFTQVKILLKSNGFSGLYLELYQR